MSSGKTSETTKAFLDHSTKVVFYLLTLLMAIVAWQGKQALSRIEKNTEAIQKIDKRVTSIEADRYTSRDAVVDNRATAKEIAGMRTWIESSFPPKWLQDDISEIKQSIKELENRN